MNTVGVIDAKVEAVVDVGHEAHVIACINSNHNFSVFSGSTLDGKTIRPWLSQPRALNAAGEPRFVLYNFTLVSKADMSSFKEGEIHPLVVNLAPSETIEAEQAEKHQPSSRPEST